MSHTITCFLFSTKTWASNQHLMAQTITSNTAEAAAYDSAIAVPLWIVLTIDFTYNWFSSPSVVAHKPPLNMMDHHVRLHNSPFSFLFIIQSGNKTTVFRNNRYLFEYHGNTVWVSTWRLICLKLQHSFAHDKLINVSTQFAKQFVLRTHNTQQT
jgi:hypothetical protein